MFAKPIARRIRKGAGLLATLVLIGCTQDGQISTQSLEAAQTFQMQFWHTPARGRDYPEMSEAAILERASFGVAFHGGGNRAAPAALGQLRALHDLGWIDSVRYITAISGGSWAAIPYTFLKNCPRQNSQTCGEDHFLGKTASPAEVARRLPELYRRQTGPEFATGSYLGAIANGAITPKVVRAWVSGRFDEAYATALEEIYLAPFGLGRAKGGGDTLFTWRAQDRARLLDALPDKMQTRIHFVERDRPYLIVGGSVLTRRVSPKPSQKFRLEMTPLYAGMPVQLQYLHSRGARLQLGGGFVESAGYDHVTHRVDAATGKLDLRVPQFGSRTDETRLNFSLANMAAVSGAAPVERGVSVPVLKYLAANFGFPEHYVPVDQKVDAGHGIFAPRDTVFEKEWAHGDGGHEDNLGIMPLLDRQVRNILAFVNSSVPLDAQAYFDCGRLLARPEALPPETNALHKLLSPCHAMIGSDMPGYFMETHEHVHNAGLIRTDRPAASANADIAAYQDLFSIAQDIAATGLSCGSYRYTPHVPTGSGMQISARRLAAQTYEPTLCFLWLGFDPAVIGNVAAAGRHMSEADQHAIRCTLDLAPDWAKGRTCNRLTLSKGFPHIGTFFDTPGYLIKTSPARLYALSNYTAWLLEKHSPRIRDAFAANGLTL